MKTFALLIIGALLTFGLSSCETAHDAADTSIGLAGHAVEKTGHAVAHGVRKVENHL